jgi:hypothetical protein
MRLFIFIFFLQVMNGFVTLFDRAGNFSIQERKRNLRGCSLTDRSRHCSFHFTSFHFTSLGFSLKGRKERRKIGSSRQKSAASGGQPRPSSITSGGSLSAYWTGM